MNRLNKLPIAKPARGNQNGGVNEGTVLYRQSLSAFGFLGPDSDLSHAIAIFDWPATPLGAIEDWSAELRTAVGLIMGSDYAMAIWWGPELVLIHNAPYQREVLGERGASFGRCFDDVWGDVAHFVRPQFDAVMTSGAG